MKRITSSSSLAPLGVSLDQVRKKGYVDLPGEGPDFSEPAWNTPSGKIELFSTTLDQGWFLCCAAVGGTSRARRESVLPA